MLKVEDQLLGPALHDRAGDAYDILKSSFKHFQQKLKTGDVRNQAKNKKNAKHTSDDFARRVLNSEYSNSCYVHTIFFLVITMLLLIVLYSLNTFPKR